MFFGFSVLEGLLLEPFGKLLDIEEAGATDNVLLKSVIDKLVLLLEHAGNVKGERGDIKPN